jgi:hypothetical protein
MPLLVLSVRRRGSITDATVPPTERARVRKRPRAQAKRPDEERGLTVESERVDVLSVVGEGHEVVSESDRVSAGGDPVKGLEVLVGDGLVERDERRRRRGR